VDSIDHPILVGLAFVSALPFGWPVIRAFLGSAADDVQKAVDTPLLSLIGWFPEWTVLKFFWLLVVLGALTVAFYKLYVFLGLAAWLGI